MGNRNSKNIKIKGVVSFFCVDKIGIGSKSNFSTSKTAEEVKVIFSLNFFSQFPEKDAVKIEYFGNNCAADKEDNKMNCPWIRFSVRFDDIQSKDLHIIYYSKNDLDFNLIHDAIEQSLAELKN